MFVGHAIQVLVTARYSKNSIQLKEHGGNFATLIGALDEVKAKPSHVLVGT